MEYEMEPFKESHLDGQEVAYSYDPINNESFNILKKGNTYYSVVTDINNNDYVINYNDISGKLLDASILIAPTYKDRFALYYFKPDDVLRFKGYVSFIVSKDSKNFIICYEINIFEKLKRDVVSFNDNLYILDKYIIHKKLVFDVPTDSSSIISAELSSGKDLILILQSKDKKSITIYNNIGSIVKKYSFDAPSIIKPTDSGYNRRYDELFVCFDGRYLKLLSMDTIQMQIQAEIDTHCNVTIEKSLVLSYKHVPTYDYVGIIVLYNTVHTYIIDADKFKILKLIDIIPDKITYDCRFIISSNNLYYINIELIKNKKNAISYDKNVISIDNIYCNDNITNLGYVAIYRNLIVFNIADTNNNSLLFVSLDGKLVVVSKPIKDKICFIIQSWPYARIFTCDHQYRISYFDKSFPLK